MFISIVVLLIISFLLGVWYFAVSSAIWRKSLKTRCASHAKRQAQQTRPLMDDCN
jgi:hypothetical protein